MNELIATLLMLGISGICLSRAMSGKWSTDAKSRRVFVLFCGAFGTVCIVQGAMSEDIYVLAARVLAGSALIASEVI